MFCRRTGWNKRFWTYISKRHGFNFLAAWDSSSSSFEDGISTLHRVWKHSRHDQTMGKSDKRKIRQNYLHPCDSRTPTINFVYKVRIICCRLQKLQPLWFITIIETTAISTTITPIGVFIQLSKKTTTVTTTATTTIHYYNIDLCKAC